MVLLTVWEVCRSHHIARKEALYTMKKYDKFIWIVFFIQLVVITVVLTTSKVDDMTIAEGKMQ